MLGTVPQNISIKFEPLDNFNGNLSIKVDIECKNVRKSMNMKKKTTTKVKMNKKVNMNMKKKTITKVNMNMKSEYEYEKENHHEFS